MDYKKVILALFLLFCFISAVNAINVDDFIIPSDYYPIKNTFNYAHEGVFLNNDNQSGLVIMKYGEDDEDINMYLNSENVSYTENDDNTVDFYDYTNTYSYGVYEVFEVDGDKFFADFWFAISGDFSDDEIDNIISKFNEDNDVELVSFSIPSSSSSSFTSSEKHWYGECTTHGWVQLNSDKHCPQCIDEKRDPRVLKNSIVYE